MGLVERSSLVSMRGTELALLSYHVQQAKTGKAPAPMLHATCKMTRSPHQQNVSSYEQGHLYRPAPDPRPFVRPDNATSLACLPLNTRLRDSPPPPYPNTGMNSPPPNSSQPSETNSISPQNLPTRQNRARVCSLEAPRNPDPNSPGRSRTRPHSLGMEGEPDRLPASLASTPILAAI